MKRAFLCGCIALAMLVPCLSRADAGSPARLRITQREGDLYVIRWRVPKTLPPEATPVPVLPRTCKSVGQQSVVDRPGAWQSTQEWRCENGLAGRSVGLQFPFSDLALTTVVRVELLSGDRFARVLAPGEGPWRLPRNTVAPDLVEEARRAVVFGISHVLDSWVHLAFVLAVGLLGRLRQIVRVLSAFTVGQLAGVLAALPGSGLGATHAGIGLALAVAVLAAESLRPPGERRRLLAVGAIAGIVHGLAVGAMLTAGPGRDSVGLIAQLLAVLGMDAAHIVSAGAVAAVGALAAGVFVAGPVRTGLVYFSGAGGIALALALAAGGGGAEPVATGIFPAPSGRPADVTATGTRVSRRVAPAASDSPIRSFLTVEPFEVRHEALLRLAGLAEGLGLEPGSTIEVADQTALLDALAALVLGGVTVRADGAALTGFVRRSDFMTAGLGGAYPRTVRLPEPLSEALVGVVVAYPTPGMPRRVSLRWDPFPGGTETIPATAIDPESVRTETLSPVRPSLSWDDTLAEDPIPAVDAIPVEPVRVPVPLLALPLLVLAACVSIVGIRRRRTGAAIATSRVILALALVVGPLAQTTLALPGSAARAPSPRQARRILAGLLSNIYRAMEFGDEAEIYDRLSVSVTGEALTEVYLEQRRALASEERGGARARIEAVEVLDATEIERHPPGFRVRSAWTVGGTVTHFGHRHFRLNRYEARIAVVPVAGTWKVRSIEILDEDRIR